MASGKAIRWVEADGSPSTQNIGKIIVSNGSISGSTVTISSGGESTAIITDAVTYYVCPSGQTTAVYNGDAGTSVTPSDSNDGLSKSTPLATIAAAAAKIAGKILLAPVTIQLADTDGGQAYFPDSVEFTSICLGGSPFSSILEKALNAVNDTYPAAYVHIRGNLTTPNNVNVTGAATAAGTTSTKKAAFVARNTVLRVEGMKINYFRAADGDRGAITGYNSRLYIETINCTSDHTGNDGSLVSGFFQSTIMLGGAFTVTNSGFARANAQSIMQTYSPKGYCSLTFSHSGASCAAFMTNEGSHAMIQTDGTMSFTGAGAYYCFWAITNSSINFNNDATATSWTFNAAAATINIALQRSVINEALSTADNPTTFTSFARRAFARNASSISYNGTTVGSSADFADGSSSINSGTFPYQGFTAYGEISSAPTPGSNTAYLYAKDNGSGQSRLYYKGDDGTEVGPIGTSAVTLGANIFTDVQTIVANVQKVFEFYRGATGQTQINGTSGGSNAWESIVYNAQRFRGTTGTPATLSSGDDILAFNGAAWQSGTYNGGSYGQSGQFLLEADGAHGSGSTPGRWSLLTTPSGSTSPAERLSLDAAGNVVVNTAAVSTSATDGFLYIPSCAGTPTGVPTAYTGRVPLVYDTTNNILYVYDGAWNAV